jgi:hypothetical protein
MDPTTARKTWRTLEPIHGLIYFAPEAADAYVSLGLPTGRGGYFASRAAAMGAVPAEVVIATFFNFYPPFVRETIPHAWSVASPEQIIGARFEAAGAALRRALGTAADGPEVAEAAALARVAAEAACERPEGRPLFAGHASLPWPTDPLLELWHAQTLLREFRGDGHIAAMTIEGVSGVEALVIHGATGDVSPSILQSSRQWPDDAWAAGVDQLCSRGWLTPDGTLTDTGAAHREWVEERTDLMALAPYQTLGDDGCARLRDLCRPLSKAIVDSGTFGFRAAPAPQAE